MAFVLPHRTYRQGLLVIPGLLKAYYHDLQDIRGEVMGCLLLNSSMIGLVGARRSHLVTCFLSAVSLMDTSPEEVAVLYYFPGRSSLLW